MSKKEHDISIVGVCTHLAEQSVGCVRQRERRGEKDRVGRERERERMHSMNIKYGILCVYELQRHQITQMMSLTRQ